MLKKDYEIYKKKNDELRPYIGHPYDKAINAMAKALGLKSGMELTAQFYNFINELKSQGGNEHVSVSFKRFKMKYNTELWNKAIDIFAEEANKIAFEDINSGNVDDIFLQALGFPREMSGRGIPYCQKLIEDMEIKLNKYVLSKNVDVNQDAVHFSLNTPGLSTSAQVAESMQNMEIVSDLISRIIESVPAERKEPYLKAFERVAYNGKSALQDDGNAEVFKYNIKVSGTMPALRNIFQSLNDAIHSGRLYIVRNLKLNVPLESDGAAVVVGFTEAPAEYVDGKKIEIKFKDDSHLAPHLRRNYGKVFIGANPFFNIEMDIEYIVLKQHEFQNR